MASAITSYLFENNLPLDKFIMLCTRAFGACQRMRDDPLDVSVPEKITPDPFHLNSMKNLEKELKKLKSLSEKASIIWAEKEINKKIKSHKKYKKKDSCTKKLKCFNDMLEKVIAWKPPSEDHIELKNFAINQLEQSIKFDDHDSYYLDEIKKLSKQTPKGYYKKELKRIAETIEYHKKHWEKEVENTNFINNWFDQLRNSF